MDAEVDVVALVDAKVTATHVIVVLVDGREIATPLSWYPRLSAASFEQRSSFQISPFGLHWPDVDEDLSVEGMLSGSRASGR